MPLEENQMPKSSAARKIAIVISSIVLITSMGVIFRWPWFWIVWEVVGAVLVSLGCIGEWILLDREHDSKTMRLERLYAIVVAIGVTMDVCGLIYGIPEAIRLENRVEELRAKNLELELRLQPRRITINQTKKFIFLTEKIPKIPIAVGYNAVLGIPETVTFAHDIRQMLSMSGFKNVTNIDEYGLVQLANSIVAVGNFGNTNMPGTVVFAVRGVANTNGQWILNKNLIERTNGIARPVHSLSGSLQPKDETRAILGELFYCFTELGIKCEWFETTNDVALSAVNGAVLFVLPK